MKCEAIYMHSSEFSVRKMCKALELCESSYYQWLRGEKRRQTRTREKQELILKVKEVFEEHNCIYGCRRMKVALEEKGIALSEWKIRRIMRENGFYPVSIRKFRPGRKAKTDGSVFDNVISQDFRCMKPNEKWAGSPKELVFHSYRGSQYRSQKYQKLLEENHIRGSMSKAGCPYDNSCMESFFANMKKEYFSGKECVTIEVVEKHLFYYIEIFYNRKRLHSALGYMSPVAFRLKNERKYIA